MTSSSATARGVSGRPALCGAGSQRVLDLITSRASSHLDRLQLLSSFLDPPGAANLWDLVRTNALGKSSAAPSSPTRRTALRGAEPGSGSLRGSATIHFAADAVAGQEAKARELDAVRMVGRYTGSAIGTERREDRLEKAAALHIGLGNFRDYCEIMVELGHVDRALAVAPAAGIPYWRELMAKIAAENSKEGDLSALPYQLAGGDVSGAVSALMARGDLAAAFVTTQALREGRFALAEAIDGGTTAITGGVGGAISGGSAGDGAGSHPRSRNALPGIISSRGGYPSGPGQAPGASSASMTVPSSSSRAGDELMSSVVDAMAKELFSAGSCPQAAASHLAVSDAVGAVNQLLMGGEVDLAVSVAKVLGVKDPALDAAFLAGARRCEQAGRHDLALGCLAFLQRPGSEVELLCARSNDPELFQMAGLPPQRAFADEAERAAAPLRVVTCLIVSGSHAKAATRGITELQRIFSSPEWSFAAAREAVSVLGSLDCALVLGPIMAEVMAYSGYVAGCNAMLRGFPFEIVEALFSFCDAVIHANGLGSLFPVSGATRAVQLAAYGGSDEAAIAESVARAAKQHGLTEAQAQRAVYFLVGALGLSSPPRESCTMAMVGDTLPRGGSKDHLRSLIGNAPIRGQHVVLEDGRTVISAAQAMMWQEAGCPWSPTRSGKRLQVGYF
jgi:hypothetical protein